MPDEHVIEYECPIDPELADDPAAAFAAWRHDAHDAGYLTEGDPRIVVHPPTNFGTDADPVYLDGTVTVVGHATKVPPPEPLPLPPFVPETALETIAAALVEQGPARFDPEWQWGRLPPHIKNFYLRSILQAITVGGTHLIVDTLNHLAEHGEKHYGLTCTDALEAAAVELQARLAGGTQ